MKRPVKPLPEYIDIYLSLETKYGVLKKLLKVKSIFLFLRQPTCIHHDYPYHNEF